MAKAIAIAASSAVDTIIDIRFLPIETQSTLNEGAVELVLYRGCAKQVWIRWYYPASLSPSLFIGTDSLRLSRSP